MWFIISSSIWLVFALYLYKYFANNICKWSPDLFFCILIEISFFLSGVNKPFPCIWDNPAPGVGWIILLPEDNHFWIVGLLLSFLADPIRVSFSKFLTALTTPITTHTPVNSILNIYATALADSVDAFMWLTLVIFFIISLILFKNTILKTLNRLENWANSLDKQSYFATSIRTIVYFLNNSFIKLVRYFN